MPLNPVADYTDQGLQPFQDPGVARTMDVTIAASQNIARGTILGELTATPGVFAPYASGNTDGTQVPKVIAKYDMQTDSAGNVTFSSAAGQSLGPQGEANVYAPCYFTGQFLTTDLTGLDQNAVTILGRLVEGTLASGIFRMK